jgi:hypothetical protein
MATSTESRVAKAVLAGGIDKHTCIGTVTVIVSAVVET